MPVHNSIDMALVDHGSLSLADLNDYTNIQDSHKTAGLHAVPAKKTSRSRVLRASCKACSDCKVKCERGKPTCNRCRTRGIDCTYECSRRLGRPVRTKHPTTSTEESLPRPSLGNISERNQPVLSSLSQMQCQDTTNGEVFPEASSQSSIDHSSAWPFEFQSPNDAPFDNLDNGYSYAEFDFTVPSPALAPYTPPLTYSTSLGSMKGSSPSQVFSPDVDYQSHSPNTNQHQPEQPIKVSKATPASQTCDCISRMLAGPSQNMSNGFSTLLQPNRPPSCDSNTQKIYDICTLLLICSCVSYDEPVIKSLAFIMSHVLFNGRSLEIGSKQLEPGNELGDTSRDSTALVRELALKLQASQPDFAKANGDMLIKYWLATLGCS